VEPSRAIRVFVEIRQTETRFELAADLLFEGMGKLNAAVAGSKAASFLRGF
jgi:hypothetical protein